MCCGALRADPVFPSSGFLLNVGSHVEDTTLEDLQLDCAQTGGAVHTNGALRVSAARLYVHGFTTTGVHAVGGHELHLSDSFLGQYWWGEDGTVHGAGNATGVAVLITGQDHWISSIIIFSASVGIQMEGGAAVISDSHIYNGGGPSLEVRADSVRVVGCYFDFNPVVLVDPIAVDSKLSQTHPTPPHPTPSHLTPSHPTNPIPSHPIPSHSIPPHLLPQSLIPSSWAPWASRSALADPLPPSSVGCRLLPVRHGSLFKWILFLDLGEAGRVWQVTHNQFVVGNADPRGKAAIWINESAGAFLSINETTVAENVFPPATYGSWRGLSLQRRATRASRMATLGGSAGNSTTFDFSNELLLNCPRFPIAAVQHSVLLPAMAQVIAQAHDRTHLEVVVLSKQLRSMHTSAHHRSRVRSPCAAARAVSDCMHAFICTCTPSLQSSLWYGSN